MFNSKFKSLIQAVHDGTTYLPNKFPRRYSIRIQIRLEYRVYHREGLMISNGNDMEAVFGIYSRGEITGNHTPHLASRKNGTEDGSGSNQDLVGLGAEKTDFGGNPSRSELSCGLH